MAEAKATKKDPVAELAGAVSRGRGLPGLARAGAEAVGGPLAFLDRSGIVLAVAGATQAQEAKLSEGASGVERVELSLGDDVVGEVRYMAAKVDGAVGAVLGALGALEVERARSVEWENEGAVGEVVEGILSGSIAGDDEILSKAREVGADLSRGGGVLMARVHPGAAQAGEWRARVLALTTRTLRAAAAGSIAALSEGEGVEVTMIVPAAEEDRLLKVEEAINRELPRSLPGFLVTISRSRHAAAPGDLERAGREAQLALNVGEAEGRSPLAFEDTGSYRLLLGTSQQELMSFYAETVEPLVVYDEQYETDLVATVEAYLDSDANVPATAKQMFTHRHTIRYRLERIRELSGHDATATEGRERLSLGIKAMRVLGIAAPRGRSQERV